MAYCSEGAPIIGKAALLIERMLGHLDRIDHWHFPTGTSYLAVGVLRKALQQLSLPQNLTVVDPGALYNRLFALQELIEHLERSSSDRISWPLVSYCDEMWHRFFPNGAANPKVFYTLTTQHNYSILAFTTRLGNLLDGLLPPDQIRRVLDGQCSAPQFGRTP